MSKRIVSRIEFLKDVIFLEKGSKILVPQGAVITTMGPHYPIVTRKPNGRLLIKLVTGNSHTVWDNIDPNALRITE